jgi:hypothetical protein
MGLFKKLRRRRKKKKKTPADPDNVAIGNDEGDDEISDTSISDSCHSDDDETAACQAPKTKKRGRPRQDKKGAWCGPGGSC